MVKHCLWCGKEFKAKPTGRKYCNYEHYVYCEIEDNVKGLTMIDKYRAIQDQMDKFHSEMKEYIRKEKAS